MKLDQIVRAHQPHESNTGIDAAKFTDGVGGIASAYARLKVGCHDVRVLIDEPVAGSQPPFERGWSARL